MNDEEPQIRSHVFAYVFLLFGVRSDTSHRQDLLEKWQYSGG